MKSLKEWIHKKAIGYDRAFMEALYLEMAEHILNYALENSESVMPLGLSGESIKMISIEKLAAHINGTDESKESKNA